jgi:hypothetical protein
MVIDEQATGTAVFKWPTSSPTGMKRMYLEQLCCVDSEETTEFKEVNATTTNNTVKHEPAVQLG